MSSGQIIGGTLGAALFLFGCGVWVETVMPSTGREPNDLWRTTTVSPPWQTEEQWRRVEPRHRRIDRYGNEVDRAIGDYRIDHTGDLYEQHSPSTELPKLAPPSL